MMWIVIAWTAAGLPVLAATLYLAGLTLVARRPLRRPAAAPHAVRVRRRFVIVVPAHNESTGIARTLQGLARVHGRPDDRRVVVIADNCTDDTAQIARVHGAEVIERNDPARRGKGYALDFAFRRLLAEPANAWQAVVVIDADTVVEPNLLRIISAHLDAGARAVQTAYLGVPGRGAQRVITQVALTAIHIVRGTARERLRLSTGLKGNGMAFTRALLAAKPHAAYTRVEDLEFGTQLALSGVRVAFAAETTVWGDMPDVQAVATRQRERWIGGRFEVARRYAMRMFLSALRRGSLMQLDAAFDLVMPPVSVLALLAAGGTGVAAALAAAGAWAPAAVWGGAMLALVLHVGDAARRARLLWTLLSLATALPRYAANKFIITLRAPAHVGDAWVRTTRAGEAA